MWTELMGEGYNYWSEMNKNIHKKYLYWTNWEIIFQIYILVKKIKVFIPG